MMRDEQAEFRQERSCVDQIATLRIINEQTIEWQTSLFLNFIDFQKSFDSVDHQVLWKSSNTMELIQSLYDRFTCQVIHERTLTEAFPLTTGVRQGCLLSPLHFLLVIDWVIRTAYSSSTGM